MNQILKLLLRIQNLYPDLCTPFYVEKDQQCLPPFFQIEIHSIFHYLPYISKISPKEFFYPELIKIKYSPGNMHLAFKVGFGDQSAKSERSRICAYVMWVICLRDSGETCFPKYLHNIYANVV